MAEYEERHKGVPLLTPPLVANGTLAAELALKYLVFKEKGEYECSHQLQFLFNQLTEPHKTALIERICKEAHQNETTLTENLNAHIMIIHSADDTTVPPSCGYDKYIKQYKDDPRFVFVHMETKGHNRLFCSPESIAYKDAFNEAYQEYAETLGTEMTEELRAEYIYTHYDVITANMPDEELFGKILAFYDASINE